MIREEQSIQVAKWLRVLYPIWMCVAIFSLLYIPSQLYVEGNAELTAENIRSNLFLFRLGVVGSLVTQILFILIPLLLYVLFEGVSKRLSVLMVLLALVSVPMTMYNELHKLTALSFLAFPEQMMQFLEMSKQGVVIPSIFWGLWLFPLGLLIIKSGYFPKIIGYCLIVAGVGYVLGSFGKILTPDVAMILSVFEVFTFGEIAFVFWIVFKGTSNK